MKEKWLDIVVTVAFFFSLVSLPSAYYEEKTKKNESRKEHTRHTLVFLSQTSTRTQEQISSLVSRLSVRRIDTWTSFRTCRVVQRTNEEEEEASSLSSVTGLVKRFVIMNCAQEFQRSNYSARMLTYAMDDDAGSWWWWTNIIGKINATEHRQGFPHLLRKKKKIFVLSTLRQRERDVIGMTIASLT